MNRKLLVVPVLPLVAACGGLQGREPVPVPEGSYTVSGTAGKTAITGRLELYEDIVFFSNLGNCQAENVATVEERREMIRARRVQLNCGVRLVFSWDEQGRVRGTAAAPVQEQRQRQGECIRPEYDSLGRFRRCLKYDVITETITTWVSGSLRVERAGG